MGENSGNWPKSGKTWDWGLVESGREFRFDCLHAGADCGVDDERFQGAPRPLVTYCEGVNLGALFLGGNLPRHLYVGMPMRSSGRKNKICYFLMLDPDGEEITLCDKDPHEGDCGQRWRLRREDFALFNLLYPVSSLEPKTEPEERRNKVRRGCYQILSENWRFHYREGESFPVVWDLLKLEVGHDMVFYQGRLLVYGGYLGQHILLFNSAWEIFNGNIPDEMVPVREFEEIKQVLAKR